MAKTYSIFLILTVGVLISELALRTAFGFCDNVLVQEDENMEYIAQPNQNRKIMGSNVIYNEYSMRSNNILEGAIKILGMGDSVINGGVRIDQKDLATDILTSDLTAALQYKTQVLNIAYKSWGPDNVYAYLEKYGNFDADILFLVVSSHDAFDNMTFKKIVGRDTNYPNRQYTFAYSEIFDRFIMPKFVKYFEPMKMRTIGSSKPQSKIKFNTGFEDILSYSQNNKIPLIIYLHPELSEVNKGSYNDEGKMIIEFAKTNGIQIVYGLKGANPSQYRDNIHLNERGQRYISRILLPVLKQHLISNKSIPGRLK